MEAFVNNGASLLLVEAFQTGGGEEKHVEQLAIELSKSGFKVYLTIPHGHSRDELSAAGVQLVELDITRAFSSVIKLRRLWGELGRPLVHSHGMRSGLVARVAILSFRHSVWTAHLSGRTAFRNLSPVKQRIYLWIHRLLSNRLTAKVIAVSETVKAELLQEGLVESHIEVIENGVYLPKGSNATMHDADPLTVGIACRMSPEKDVPTFLEAISLLNQGGVSVHSICAGDGPELDEYRELARNHGISSSVKFLGHVDLEVEFWPEVDIFCLPSRAEGRSLALLEAMAHGVCCVVSDISANREVVGTDRGVKFSPGNPEQLAIVLTDLLRNKEERFRLAFNGRKWVTAHGNHQQMIAKTIDLYFDISATFEYPWA